MALEQRRPFRDLALSFSPRGSTFYVNTDRSLSCLSTRTQWERTARGQTTLGRRGNLHARQTEALQLVPAGKTWECAWLCLKTQHHRVVTADPDLAPFLKKNSRQVTKNDFCELSAQQ